MMSDSNTDEYWSESNDTVSGQNLLPATPKTTAAAKTLLNMATNEEETVDVQPAGIEKDIHVDVTSLKDLDPKVAEMYFTHLDAKLQADLGAKQMQLEQQRVHFELEKQRMEHELAKFRIEQEIQAAPSVVSETPNAIVRYKGPKVPKFVEGEDVDVYLRTFEKLARVHEWDRGHGQPDWLPCSPEKP
jgi:hypothetical protein